MKLRFKLAVQLWLILEDVVVQVFSSDWRTREFFEAMKLWICRTFLGVRTIL